MMNSPSTSDGKNPTTARWNPKPEDGGLKFLWDSDKKAFLGRTGSSWAKIGLFYVVFYAFLAGFFSIMMTVFYQTLKDHEPSYVGDASILRNPGLGFRPHLEMENKMHQLHYKTSDTKKINKFAEDIDELLKPYLLQNETEYRNCSEEKEDDRHCQVDLTDLERVCKSGNNWGYDEWTPTFFFKLNKMIGFVPKPLSTTKALPEGLKQYLTNNSLSVQDKVWVWCESDKEGVKVEHSFPGLPLYYYPYHFSETYLQPLVCVRISNLPVDKEVKVTCRLWADNIEPTTGGRSTGRAVFNIKASAE